MEQWIFISAIFIICLLGFSFFIVKTYTSKGTNRTQNENRLIRKFAAVTITPCANACFDVTVLEKKRFLSTEARLLPLTECDRTSCQCRYVHHDDRRSGEDRRYPTIEMETEFSEQNKRSKKDRRQRNYV